MKKITILLMSAALLVSYTNLQAQERGGKRGNKLDKREKMGEGRKAGFGKNLDLTEQQKADAKKINDEYNAKVKALKSNDKLTMAEYNKQMAELQKERRTKLEALLTPEQKAKATEMKENAQEKADIRQEKMLEKMKTNLNLSDDQVAKIKSIHENYATKAKAIREDKNLSAEQKKDQLATLAKERKEAVNNVLTPEQKEKQKSLKNRD
jgi:Spy/CpxP family protein refolding chaperone